MNFLKSAIGNRQSAIGNDSPVSESLEDLTGVILRLYFLKDFFDLAFLIDQKGGPMDAHICSSHELLLSPNAVSLRDRAIRVGQKSEWEFILCLKLFVRRLAVWRNTQHSDTFLFEHRKSVAKRAGFFCATRRVVFRIKIKHDLLPSKVL